MSSLDRIHGGADAEGVCPFDFSTNTNACPPSEVAELVMRADISRYPDFSYSKLRSELANFHGVDKHRILLAGSASEWIYRFTGWARLQGCAHFSVPEFAYGDYSHAARAWGVAITTRSTTEPSDTGEQNALSWQWCCSPSSPFGQADIAWKNASRSKTVVLDCAYAPLQLEKAQLLDQDEMSHIWQLWSPNKALGLTGVRAAYVIAPVGSQDACLQLEALCPSWPIGGQGVAMLMAWTDPQVQMDLANSRVKLQLWKQQQIQLCEQFGWYCYPSEANFFVARPSVSLSERDLFLWRQHGIKLRDCASFGLPGCWRLSVQSPLAQQALLLAMKETRV
jgi:histidinol-phosphate aminotransferase